MNYSKIMKYVVSLAALFIFTVTSYATNVSGQEWSFEFRDCSLDEAVQEISDETGVNIEVANIRQSQISHKRYANDTIENILMNLFKSSSKAFVWYYRENDLVAVDIQLMESDSLYGAGKISSRPTRSRSRYSAAGRYKGNRVDSRDFSRPDEKLSKEEKERRMINP